jgi:hypothetical protein
MPSNFTVLKDVPPIHGMNTVDDPGVLLETECVLLVNAMPGNPPLPRKGCQGQLLANTSTLRWVPPGVTIEISGVIYIIAWVFDTTNGGQYKIVSVNSATTGNYTSLGTAVFSAQPTFGLLVANEYIYCTISEAMASWNGVTAATGNKVLESPTIIRDMCISATATIVSVAQTASGGSFAAGDVFEYGFTYVRRTDSGAFETGGTPTGMILPPTISGKPKRIDTYLPGAVESIESIDSRKIVTISSNNTYTTLNIATSQASAIAQGATHLRVWRTRKQTSAENAAGTTKFFICDLPLGVTATLFDDTRSDAAPGGEEQQLAVGYTNAPLASYSEYVKGRMFLMAPNGKVYFSETPAGDGATNLETALIAPQKYLSMYKPDLYYIDNDRADGQLGGGLARIGDDLFMFKERKIFGLFGGDPVATVPTSISDTIGCAFPHTITKADIKGSLGKCLLFLSNIGPAVISEGGSVRQFSEFKIAELWPEMSTELYGELDTNYEWIVNNCTACFYQNNWYVMYRTFSGTFRCFAYYFSPDLSFNPSAAKGAWEVRLA